MIRPYCHLIIRLTAVIHPVPDCYSASVSFWDLVYSRQRSFSAVCPTIRHLLCYPQVLLPSGPKLKEKYPASQYQASWKQLHTPNPLVYTPTSSVSVSWKKTISISSYGKYKSVLAGKTNVFALIDDKAFSKSPLYGSCLETSPFCQV